MTHSVNDIPDSTGGIVDAFSQHGLIGLVVLALFGLVFYTVREFRAINEMHNERHDKRNELHASERREWLQVTREIAETLNTLAGQFEARLTK